MQTSISSAEALGAIMRARRIADGIKQKEVVESTGLSLWNLLQLEKGRDRKVTTLLRWMRSMGITWIIEDPKLTDEEQV